jgi:hypothetical protein
LHNFFEVLVQLPSIRLIFQNSFNAFAQNDFFRDGFQERKTLSLQRHSSIVQQQNYCQKLLRLGKSGEVVLRKVLGGGDSLPSLDPARTRICKS